MAHVYDTAEKAAVADERRTLEAFLDYYRDVIKAKVTGVSEDDARRRLVPSLTTLAGVLKHLVRVEVSWFQHRLAQMPSEDLPILKWIDEEDGDFTPGPEETVGSLVALYDEQCAVSREVVARFDLDRVVPHPYLDQVSMRWILVHMIEETARHAGHADILREQLDGSTGD